MTESRQFQPTQRKLDQARGRGRLLRGQAFYQLIGTLGAGGGALGGFKFFCLDHPILLEYQRVGLGLSTAEAAAVGSRIFLWIVLPALFSAAFCSVLTQWLHLGFRFLPRLCLPTPGRIGLVGGLRKVFGGFRDLWQIWCKTGVLFGVLYLILSGMIEQLPIMVFGPWADALGAASRIARCAVWMLGAAVFCLAAMDYWIQRQRYFRELSMSHNDLRREQRETEGDPLIKAVRRAEHEALSRQDLAERVRRSSVVVVDRNGFSAE